MILKNGMINRGPPISRNHRKPPHDSTISRFDAAGHTCRRAPATWRCAQWTASSTTGPAGRIAAGGLDIRNNPKIIPDESPNKLMKVDES